MEEAVAALLASPLVNIVKNKLRSAIAKQASLLWNFGDDLGDMKNDLEIISVVLEDAERRSVEEKLVQLWLKRLKDAALDISDVVEDYQDNSDQANAMMPGVLSCLPMAYKKIGVANRMKSLREKLSKIRNEIDSFNFRKGCNTIHKQYYDEREKTSSFLEEPVIGRYREKQEIINMLSANTNNDDTVILPIFGLGGMGKTTLARLVYNDAQFTMQYDKHVWVYVSQDFSLNKIGMHIISQVRTQGGELNMGTQQMIEDHLNELLHGKKVLVVLDDLWEEKTSELGKLKKMLRVKGSKVDVIVTTRKEEIAMTVSTSERRYKLQTLEDDKCCEIIKRYSKLNLKSNQENMEQIGLDIAKKCGGVALAAQVVGSMLQYTDDLDGWIEMNSSDIWNRSSEDNDVLPPLLRVCFSYCALFPKGHDIIEDDLVQQWIALDFIKQSKGKEYIKQRLGMSFLQVSLFPSTSQEQVVRYTMHDQLRQMSGAYSFANCLRASGILFPASVGQLRQLRCLIAPRMQNESLPECITELRKLQYLNINGSSQISALPESIGKLGCLKYLCMSGCSGISKLPESFGDFKFMVHLDMSDCDGIIELPDSLGNLTNLQHLDLSRCSSLKAIPEPLCGLTQLEYLDISFCEYLDRLPEGIGGLMELQFLNMSSCDRIRELPESLMKLQNLLHLDLSDCTSMQRLGSVRGLTTLQHLNVSRVWVWDIVRQDSSYVLVNLTNLKFLGLSNSIIHGRAVSASYVPYWINGLTNLEHLDLSYNWNLACLPESIGNLKRLHRLDLTKCSGPKSLPKSIGTLGLKTLLLDGCSDEMMDQASSVVNYSLILPLFMVRADEVNGCSNLHLLEGIHVSELRIRSLENARSLEEATKVKLSGKHSLSELTLSWSAKRAVQILEDKDLLEQLVPPTGLKRMRLEGYNCTSFPGWLMDISCYLTNLVYIRLQDLPMCRKLPPLGQLWHLEKLELCNLPGIKRIDREFCGGKGAFRRLSSFKVKDMKGLEEWNTTYSVEDGVEEFMFPVLDNLEIEDCPWLRLKPCPPTFRKGTICRSDRVISSLEEVDKTSHYCFSSRPVIKLDLIELGYSCKSIRLFHHFPLLRELTIISGEHLTSLEPESMWHLTSLESLTLRCCDNISGLPQWLGDLSSLKSLVISGCGSIMSLPSCIQRLTKLQKLQISDNQELKEWCESEENKAKLAHIINFQVFEDSDLDSYSDSECEIGTSAAPLRPVALPGLENREFKDIGADDDSEKEAIDVEAKEGKKRKQRSAVWDHFTKVDGQQVKAICHYCKRKITANGTSVMRKHLNTCKSNPHRVSDNAKQGGLSFAPMRLGADKDVDEPARRRRCTQSLEALQSQLAELRAAQEASQEAHRREMEAQRREIEARDEAQRRQLQFFTGFLQQIPGVVLPPLPPELFAPPPPPGPTWTPTHSAGWNPTPRDGPSTGHE